MTINKYGIEEWNTPISLNLNLTPTYNNPTELIIQDLERITKKLKKARKEKTLIDYKFYGNYLHNLALNLYNGDKNDA